MVETKTFFSIITVCYNEKNRIAETLKSVVEQKNFTYEHLILDGGSTDGTLEIIKKYSEINPRARFISERDGGIYDAMNKGIALAKGKYVFFLNAGDTFYSDDVLSDVKKYMEDLDTIYVGAINGINMDGTQEITYFSCKESEIKETLVKGGGPCHQAIFAPIETLRAHKFNLEYSLAADLEWFDYSYSNGVQCKDIPVIISNFDRCGVSGQNKYRKQYITESFDIVSKYFSRNLVKNILSEDYLRLRMQAEKDACIVKTFHQWMRLRNRNIHLKEYFEDKGYKDIAVYGNGMLGRNLVDELMSDGIIISAIYDHDPEGCRDGCHDVVVITAEFYYGEIAAKLRGYTSCSLVSIEDILMYLGDKHHAGKY